MKYDVFISYSRKDTAIADKVCAAFDRVGISYFIDRQGIGGGFEFPRVLAENIIGSQLFLLLASENAYASKFTTNEIVFAFNKKPKQSILPYIIDGSSLPLELEFTFAGINWRNIADHPIDSVLVTDILTLLGKPAKVAQSAPAPAKPQPKVEVKPQPEPVAKTYKVGDYYNENGKEGIVFDVWDNGRYGKIVSLDEAELSWGDALAWCRRKGRGWYLPDIDELELLLEKRSVHDAVNCALGGKNATKLNEEGDFATYWSSTERDEDVALHINMFIGGYSGSHKFNESYVRAVAEF